jgi:hypothetical protein
VLFRYLSLLAEGSRFTGKWHFDIDTKNALTVSGTTVVELSIKGPDWCGHDIARLIAKAYYVIGAAVLQDG